MGVDWTADELTPAAVEYGINDGYTLDLCVKSGTGAFDPGDDGTDGMRQTTLGLTGHGTVTLDKDVSHFSYRLHVPPPPIPPRLTQLCLPVEDAPALPALGIDTEITLIPDSTFLLVTIDADETERLLEGFHGATRPQPGNDPCPVPVPPVTDTPRPDDVAAPPVVEVSDVALEQTAPQVEAEQAEVPASALKELPYTGVSWWQALLGILLIAAGVWLIRSDRSA